MFPYPIRIVIAIFIIIHGIGHGMGLLPLFGKKLSASHSADSWVLGPLLGPSLSRAAGSVIWVLCIAGFLLAGMGFMGWIVPSQWPSIAAVSSVMSLAGLALFWNAFPFWFPNKVSVIVVDVFVLSWVMGWG
jgi:hypothetical protein